MITKNDKIKVHEALILNLQTQIELIRKIEINSDMKLRFEADKKSDNVESFNIDLIESNLKKATDRLKAFEVVYSKLIKTL